MPRDGKLEARLRGANITPGYWRDDALTAAAFDDEGYYKIGDALKFEDPADPAKGLLFDGRLAEDFKLATGTWVSVGPLRASFIAHFAPLVRDVVFAGADRDEVTALGISRSRGLPQGRARSRDPAASGPSVACRSRREGRVRAACSIPSPPPSSGASSRVTRAILLADPPSLDIGEMTDKGSINQRAVLAHRAALVEALYADAPPPHVIVAGGAARTEGDLTWIFEDTPRSSPAALPASAPRPRAMLAEAGAKVAIFDVNDEGAPRDGEKNRRPRGPLRRHRGRRNRSAVAAASRARHGAHPGQLRRRRPGQAHRRPRRTACRSPISRASSRSTSSARST